MHHWHKDAPSTPKMIKWYGFQWKIKYKPSVWKLSSINFFRESDTNTSTSTTVLFNFNVTWLNREKFSLKSVIENLCELVLDSYKMKYFPLILYHSRLFICYKNVRSTHVIMFEIFEVCPNQSWHEKKLMPWDIIKKYCQPRVYTKKSCGKLENGILDLI